MESQFEKLELELEKIEKNLLNKYTYSSDRIKKACSEKSKQILQENIYDMILETCSFNEITNKDFKKVEINKAKKLAKMTIQMISAIEIAREGRGKKFISRSIRVGEKTLRSWLKIGESAVDEVDKINEEGSEYIDYEDHEDFMFIEFFFDFDKAVDFKNNEREDNIDNQAKDLTDAEGNVVRTGSYKASAYMLEKKNKDEYQEIKNENSEGISNPNAGVLIINNAIPEYIENKNEQELYLENLSKESQKDLSTQLENKSKKIEE